MKTVFPNIESELKSRGMDYRQLAKEIGISDLAMYRRMAGITRWTLPEAIKISWIFDGADVNYLFIEKERS